MKSMEIRDLIEALKPFDQTAQVTMSASALDIVDLDEGDEAVDKIGEAIEKIANASNDTTCEEQVKSLREILKDIQESMDILGPVWDDVYNRKKESDEIEIVGVEQKNSSIGVHAVIICNE